MTQYIDKSAIVAEIETYISNYKEILYKIDKSSDDWISSTSILESKIDVLQHILAFLDSLEVKEVDLEKEKDDYWNKLCDDEFGELLERDAKWFDDIAKHFFELGLKYRKESKL